MAKDELMLKGTVQTLQDTPATDLGHSTTHPLTDVLADLLEVNGSNVRTGITLDQTRSWQTQGGSAPMAV